MKSLNTSLLIVEDRARRYFERTPFIQAFLAGIGVIIFWRGVWEWLDSINVTPLVSVVIGSLILGGVGVFVQTFIGNTIIIKKVKQEESSEKKSIETVRSNVDREGVTLEALSEKIDHLLLKIEQR